MPELPDLTLYRERLEARTVGQPLEALEILDPFCLRTVEPTPSALEGRDVRGVRRLGKRLVIELEEELFAVIHLMIAGRLRWRESGKRPPRPKALATFHFAAGTLFLTEAGSRRRASLHLVRGREGLATFDRGGVEPFEIDLASFREVLRRENRTLKRFLTDPRLVAGIGNAYSDEILFEARLSPMKTTATLDEDGTERLHRAMRNVLARFVDELRQEVGDGFPEKVTAFRPSMAVHGRHGEPCRVCSDPIQRIRYAENECNYCATCQVEGRLLRDRALSLLLKKDWPRTLGELEERRGRGTE